MTTWTVYHADECVRCPAPDDRRGHWRGDRRTEVRTCGHRISRVGPGTMVLIRVKRQGQPITLGLSMVQECERCHAVLELHTCADSRAA